MKTKITVDPVVNILYASFYVKGLNAMFGKNNVRFEAEPFLQFSYADRITTLLFTVTCDDTITKYALNYDDSYKIKEEIYEWCDIYGNVNTNYQLTPAEFHPKLVSLAPSFGIRVWDLPQTCCYAISNLLKCSGINKKKFLGKYKRMYQMRLPYEKYLGSNKSSDDYVFHLSTLWYNDEWNKNDEGVNLSRANFIRVCKSIEGIDFEGGLVSQGESSSNEKFKDCIFDRTVAMPEWIEKTKRSAIVFNTPAFWNCHGWKLGEYLALGKAIISTPLFNDLPEPLIHGENIHFVDNNQQAVKEAVSYIINHPSYKEKLETGARQYWEKYGTPEKSLGLLIKNIN